MGMGHAVLSLSVSAVSVISVAPLPLFSAIAIQTIVSLIHGLASPTSEDEAVIVVSHIIAEGVGEQGWGWHTDTQACRALPARVHLPPACNAQHAEGLSSTHPLPARSATRAQTMLVTRLRTVRVKRLS